MIRNEYRELSLKNTKHRDPTLSKHHRALNFVGIDGTSTPRKPIYKEEKKNWNLKFISDMKLLERNPLKMLATQVKMCQQIKMKVGQLFRVKVGYL